MRTIGLGDPRVLLPLFLVESTSVGYIAMAYCVCLSLVLILIGQILGGEGTSSEDWYPLVLETAFSSRKTS
jgi:hypothetical protein